VVADKPLPRAFLTVTGGAKDVAKQIIKLVGGYVYRRFNGGEKNTRHSVIIFSDSTPSMSSLVDDVKLDLFLDNLVGTDSEARISNYTGFACALCLNGGVAIDETVGTMGAKAS
jgi:hypothetical protein